ncbi:MAG TPA: hypothetical protein VFC09_16085 [Candidatus Dormibacteraeota bacterium]|nr:hypothetical protein [Candidatus Dormibacteraeota bacterium]
MAQEKAWTGTPVRPHPGARSNGAAELPWGGRREGLPLRWPFATAVEGFRAKALANPQYDPASTFVWGQMMAVGLVAVLGSVEAAFGAAGHDAARAALRRVGAQIAAEMIEGVELPPDLSPVEAASLFASWINEVVYASIEKPRLHGDSADFDIHYCPHEDVYGAFDCRVQRYLVEGMIDAGRAFFGSGALDVAFATTIPSGSATCHFDIVPRAEGAEEAWTSYSDALRDRALRRLPVVERPDTTA